MKRGLLLISLCAIGLAAVPAQAEVNDKVFYVDRTAKPNKKGDFPIAELSGTISAAESASGITISSRGGLKRDIAAADIKNIHYDPRISGISKVKAMYTKAHNSEQEAEKEPAKRIKLLSLALLQYKELLANAKDSFPKSAVRNMEYKVALLTLAVYPGDKAKEDEAIKLLSAFRDTYKNSWQISSCLERLGDLQVAREDYKGAVKTFDGILALKGLSDEAKGKYRMLAADALVKAKDFKTAQARLDSVLKTLKPNDPQYFPLQVRLIKCEAVTDAANAIKKLEKIIKNTKEEEKYKKAVAYNTLGDCYLLSGKPGDALFPYLYVAVWYKTDREELAKAYKELIAVYGKLNNPARVKAYQEELLKLNAK